MVYILASVCAVLFLVADQISKHLVASSFQLGESRPVIDGFFDFTYIQNNGGAWGVLSGYTWLLVAMTVVAMLVCFTLLLKANSKRKLLFWSISLILSGGVGNMIDRVFRGGNVVDFIHLQFIEFPIFNIADCAVVIGAGLLLLHFILDFAQSGKKSGELEQI